MKHNYFFYLIFCLFTEIVHAQVLTQTIQPNNLSEFVKFHSKVNPPIVHLPLIDVDKFRQEEDKTGDKNQPPRYGVPMKVDLSLDDGTWEFSPSGGRVWKLAIKSSGATTLNIFFDKLYLPKGVVMFAYNADKTRLFGPVTSDQNNKRKNLATSLLNGDIIVLELFEPIYSRGLSELHISHVVHGYTDFRVIPPGSQGQIGNCHHDVTCPQGNNFQGEVDAVAMMISPRFGRWCSGTLLNNACNNLKPNFLTAFHCVDGVTGDQRNNEISQSEADELNNFSFFFNYKASSCGGNENNLSFSLMGGDLVSSWNQTDFALIKLRQSPIAGSGARFAGWDRSGNVPTNNVVGIHHPQGNVMKISVSSESPEFVGGLKWRVLWGDGVTDNGSSGSGLFTNQNKIIGQLIGGQSSCGDLTKPDFYGSLSVSWSGNGTSNTRLSNHLTDDPTVITTNTIPIPSMNIPDDLCGDSPISYLNIPPNMTITGGGIYGAHLTSFFQSLAPNSGFNGEGYFELQLKPIGITCNDPLILRKTFNVGVVTPEVLLYNNWDCSGWVYIGNVKSGTTYNWIIDYNGQHQYYQGTSVYLPQSSTGNLYYYLEASNACGTSWVEDYRQLQGCGGWYAPNPADVDSGKKYDWKMQLSPNPASNDLNISLSEYNERQLHTLGDVKIFNMTGQVVHQSKQILDNTMRMNIQNLNNGFYIMEIRGEGFSTRQRFNVSR